MQPSEKGGIIEFPTGVEDLGKKLPVKLSISECMDNNANPRFFILHKNGILTRESVYLTNVPVEDDGGASGIEIICKGRHENRGGKLFLPMAEDIYIEYSVKSPRNGQWQAQKDPVTFLINGTPQKSPYLLPDKAGAFHVDATTQSGKSSSAVLNRLPRTDAIVLNIGHLAAGDGTCTILREKKATGLCTMGTTEEDGRRVKSISCALGDDFIIDTYGVLNADHSAEVWNNQCSVQLLDADNNPVPDDTCIISKSGDTGKLKLQIKRSGDYTLHIASKDVQEIAYDVDFHIFDDFSKVAMSILLVSFALAFVTTMCWYGLSVWNAPIYLLCPAALFFISTRKAACIRRKWHRIIYYIAMAGVVLIIVKALVEELR